MTKRTLDPLLSALIDKLPPTGTEWPVEEQTAWLKIMAMAFGSVYGSPATVQFNADKPSIASAKPQAAPASKVKLKVDHNFIIDLDGYARDAKGARILPKDIKEYIFDMRGALSDMRSIIWADGSTGLNGADIVINA
jgi:hypothetical protein